MGIENWKNSVLNCTTAQRRDISSEALFKCVVAVLQLKSILEVSSKVRNSIEDPFSRRTWLGSVRVGLHVRDQDTTTASGICECYCLVSSYVF
jgi:hypothetical protein